ncbi:hypothetical protein ACTA71_006421 [Dictyostelium dimigraforme]
MEYNEILFWKVFHNKFIFNNIIEQISNIQLEYERIDLYRVGNRIKFKEFQSLKVMVLKKQFQLLKCKLDNNESVLYNKESIDFLIRDAPFDIIKLFTEKYRIKQNDPQLEKLNVMIDLVFHSAKNNNLDSFRYFINEFQLPVEKIVFEYILEEKSIEFIDIILNSNQFKLEESTRKSCLKLISNNKNNFQQLIEYVILKRPELNFFTSKTVAENYIQRHSLKFQSDSYKPEILDFLAFYNLKSKETKLKILEMGCVSRITPDFIYFNNIKPNNWKGYEDVQFFIFIILQQCDLERSIAKDTTLEIIKNEIDKIKDCGNIKTDEKCKQLHQLIIMKLLTRYSSKIYEDYLKLYDQIIEGTDYRIVFHYTFSTFSVNGLKYLIDCKKKSVSITETITINETIKMDNLINNEKRIVEFLKIYFKSKESIPQLHKGSIGYMFLLILNHCSIETLNEILELKPQDEMVMGFLSVFIPENQYQSPKKGKEFIQEISKNKDNDRFIWFTEKFIKRFVPINQINYIYNFECLEYIYTHISTKNHIDFLIENKQKNIYTEIQFGKKYFEIETLELIYYFQKRLNLPKPSPSHCHYLYLKSLFNGDFKTFQEIDNIENLEMEYTYTDLKSIKIDDQLIHSILENINKSKLKNLAGGSKIIFLQFLSQNEKQKLNVIDNLQFNLFPLEIMVILLDNILDVNVKASITIINKLVINGEFQILKLVNTIQQYEKKRTFTIYKPIEGKQVKNGYNAKEQLIPFIKSLFNKLKENINDRFKSLSHYYEINFIFSYLYKLLIQCDDITLDLINDVRQFYFSNDLAITDDLFTLSCYLGLRSNQFIKYLSGMKIRLESYYAHFLTGHWSYYFASGDQNYTLDFNLMLKDNNMVTIDNDFFDLIYQTTKSNDHNIDFFKKIVFFKLRYLMVELKSNTQKPSIAEEVNILIDLNRADMVLELTELEKSKNNNIQFPFQTISNFMNIATLEQFKKLNSIIGQHESNLKPIKFVLLNNSISFRKFEYIDYFLKDSNLFIEELTKKTFNNINNLKFFIDIFTSNDLEMIEYLLKYYGGNRFKKTTKTITTTTPQPTIDLFEDFRRSGNYFQIIMNNGLIDMYGLLHQYFLFIPSKDNILNTINNSRFKFIEYLFKNDYLKHIDKENLY